MSSARPHSHLPVDVFDLTGPVCGDDVINDLQRLNNTNKGLGAEPDVTASIMKQVVFRVDARVRMAELVEGHAKFRGKINLNGLSPKGQVEIREKLKIEEINYRKGYLSGQTFATLGSWSATDRIRIRLFRMEHILTSTAQVFADSWDEACDSNRCHPSSHSDYVLRMHRFCDHILKLLQFQQAVYKFLREQHAGLKHDLSPSPDGLPIEIKVFNPRTKTHTPTMLIMLEHCLTEAIVAWLHPVSFNEDHHIWQHPDVFVDQLKRSTQAYKDQYEDVNQAFHRAIIRETSSHYKSLCTTRMVWEPLHPLWLFTMLEEILLTMLFARNEYEEIKAFEEKVEPLIRDLAIAISPGRHLYEARR